MICRADAESIRRDTVRVVRALVTGATGKVGNAVARKMVERGDEVVALVRDVDGAPSRLPAGVEMVRGDVTDISSVQVAADGVDGVFNCMGIFEQWVPDPGEFDRVNAIGAANVVAAAREAGARRVVHTSTYDVFHAARGGTVREDEVADYRKATAYERSKQRAEELVLAEAALGIEVVIVNPAGVYGPGPWAEAGFDGMLRDVVLGKLRVMPSGGATLVLVDDVAAAHLAAFDRGRAGERYIAANGFATMHELCELAVAAAGRGRVPHTIPAGIARALAAAGELLARLTRRPPMVAAGDLHWLLWEARADASKAERELGVTFTPWPEGVRRTLAWLEDCGRLDQG
jgi:dihydroflavonol-4-reductase